MKKNVRLHLFLLEGNSLTGLWIVQAVQFPPLCPPIQVAKAHFGDFAGMAEKASVPHFPYFICSPLESIVYEMAWHIYERCIQELITWKI